MIDDESGFIPDTKREVSQEARELINLFQRAKNTIGEERTNLLRQFLNRLHELISPGRATWTPDNQLSEIIIDGIDKSPIPVHTGTEGQRIYFSPNKPYDGTPKSVDGKAQWMFYPKPPKDDRYGGKEFYDRFVVNFGEEIVNMLQKLV